MKAEGPRAAETAFAMSLRRQKPQQMQGTKTKLRRCSSARNKFYWGICLDACDGDGSCEGWSVRGVRVNSGCLTQTLADY